VHAQKEAQRVSADELAELQNLRDMNHALFYELSMARSELNDCKRQMATLRVELQQTKDERGAWQAEVSFMPMAVVV
jgi:chromosome segregation ATPase